jgi:hypothetical protein
MFLCLAFLRLPINTGTSRLSLETDNLPGESHGLIPLESSSAWHYREVGNRGLTNGPTMVVVISPFSVSVRLFFVVLGRVRRHLSE